MDVFKKRWFLIFILVLAVFMTGCVKEKDEELHSFAVWKKTDSNAYTFEDGTVVEKWKNEDETVEQYRYRLLDGTDLLEETVTSTLDQVKEKNLKGLEGLDASVQDAIRQYYKQQGLMFQPEQMLEKAYADYLSCEKNKEHFTFHQVSQDITETAETSKYIVFLTAVQQPKTEHYTGDTAMKYKNVLFSREDGKEMDIWEIFNIPEEEVKKELVQLCAKEDTTVTEEDIASVIDKADILLFQDYMEIWFPYGTWQRQEFDKGFGFEYEHLKEIMYPWAIPAERQTAETESERMHK